MPARSDNKVVGSAGEHFVCSVLAQLGWAAALTREGVARADVLAVHPGDQRDMIEVQVKTISHNSRPSWPMGGTGWMSPSASEREWYVFVLLGSDERHRPRCFVVPRDHATAGAWMGHMGWLTDPAQPKGKRNTPIERLRAGIDLWERYEEQWGSLRSSAWTAPVLLPTHMRALIDEPRIEFPNWHPWRRNHVPDFKPAG